MLPAADGDSHVRSDADGMALGLPWACSQYPAYMRMLVVSYHVNMNTLVNLLLLQAAGERWWSDSSGLQLCTRTNPEFHKILMSKPGCHSP